jgi:hypothetical protein
MKTSWKRHYLAEKMNRESLEERLETEKRIKESYAKQKQIEILEKVKKMIEEGQYQNEIYIKLEHRIKELKGEVSE